MADTGAYIPVWTDDESILTDKLGAELIKKMFRLPALEVAQRGIFIR